MLTHSLSLTSFSWKLDTFKEVDVIFKRKQNLYFAVYSIQLKGLDKAKFGWFSNYYEVFSEFSF